MIFQRNLIIDVLGHGLGVDTKSARKRVKQGTDKVVNGIISSASQHVLNKGFRNTTKIVSSVFYFFVFVSLPF